MENFVEKKTFFEESLIGGYGLDQQRIAEKFLEIATIVLKKNNDYGSAVWRSPKLLPSLKPKDGIMVRLSDKMDRLENLSKNGGAAYESESFQDTVMDVIGYSILWLSAP